MKIRSTALQGVKLIEPDVYGDPRGFFLEYFNQPRFQDEGLDLSFAQLNHSRSSLGVLRGLHYQLRQPQGKLVQVISGEVFDVAVDIRTGSPSFGQWVGEILSDSNHRQLYVPPGFAHGFCVLSETAHVSYKCSANYDPQDEGGILWSDPSIAIRWPVKDPILSEKDQKFPCLSELPLSLIHI